MAMILPTIILLLLTIFSSQTNSIDLPISHINTHTSPFYPSNQNLVENIQNLASNDLSRINDLFSLEAHTRPPIASGHLVNVGNYVVRVKIGTPAQLFFMVLDTSADITWVPCKGCLGCNSTSFDPKRSATYGVYYCGTAECSQVNGGSTPPCCPDEGLDVCQFKQSYGDGKFTATLSRDYLRLDKDILPNFAFGCVNNASGKDIKTQGLLGLGRGPFSLFAQSGSFYSGVFSYCLPSFTSFSFSGSLRLGPEGQPKKIPTTPLLTNPHRPSLNYVNLTGIRVGSTEVPLDPSLLEFNPGTGAGTIIDSGTVITRFTAPIYNATRDAFRAKVKGPFTSRGLFDTCFATEQATISPPPRIELMFEGMNVKLPLENSLIKQGNVTCLALASSPQNVNSVLNIIANLQQQNLRILIDVNNSRLGIKREACN